jgi:hypothetical protein
MSGRGVGAAQQSSSFLPTMQRANNSDTCSRTIRLKLPHLFFAGVFYQGVLAPGPGTDVYDAAVAARPMGKVN